MCACISTARNAHALSALSVGVRSNRTECMHNECTKRAYAHEAHKVYAHQTQVVRMRINIQRTKGVCPSSAQSARAHQAHGVRVVHPARQVRVHTQWAKGCMPTKRTKCACQSSAQSTHTSSAPTETVYVKGTK